MENNIEKKLKCYDCKYFYTSRFCGYDACECSIYGSLDVDQKERHPDKTANTCPDYVEKEKEVTMYKLSDVCTSLEKYEHGIIKFIDRKGNLIQYVNVQEIRKISSIILEYLVTYEEILPANNTSDDEIISLIQFVNNTDHLLKIM